MRAARFLGKTHEGVAMQINQSVRVANLPVMNAYANEVGTVVALKPGKVQVRFACSDYTVTLWFLESELTIIG